VKRVLPVFFIGGAFVGVVEVLGHRGVGTPIPFWLMLPRILAGALAPDSGFNPEGDTHPWGADFYIDQLCGQYCYLWRAGLSLSHRF
jgi:hypothetical protein